MCDKNVTAWGYNSTSDTCEEFLYGGCDKNDNNFMNQNECEATCEILESLDDT